MKSYLSISLIFSVLSIFASVGSAKKWDTMKMPDYKNVAVVVEEIPKNYLGITRDRLATTAKLRLLRNGLKASVANIQKGYIHVEVAAIDVTVHQETLGSAIVAIISFLRLQDGMTISEPLANQQEILIMTDYGKFENIFNAALDRFILDYLESNME